MNHCHLLTAGSLHAIHVEMRQAHLPVCSHPNKKKKDLIILLYFWCSFEKSFILAGVILQLHQTERFSKVLKM